MSFFKRRRHPQPGQLAAEDHDTNVDQDLRLRTVRTAASTIAESIASEQRAVRRRSVRHNRSKFFRSKILKHPEREQPSIPIPDLSPVQISGNRRSIYVNMPLTAMEVDRHGEPVVRYARNKVKTTKYTILTFIPKNLYEQFRRYDINHTLFFFPIFGAVSPQTAALPLMFILAVTAVKDAIEDYRRATLDEEVNTSAATKIGNWHNINQPKDPRNWLERLLGLNSPGHVTKGVRKLREREASEGSRIVLSRADNRTSYSVTDPSSLSLDRGSGKRLEDIQSVDSHSYPPFNPPRPSFSTSAQNLVGNASSATLTTASSSGVVDWSKRISGSARWERTLWKKLEVGDVVLLRDNEQVPADIAVLSTSDSDGLCYLETKNLDGETNLKPRKAINATSSILSEEDIERSAFVLDSEPPHPNLYLYNGVFRFRDQVSGQSKTEPVTINEMLLRGCSIRNTAWVVGLVVFTGKDTKIMLNGGETPSKRSKIEKETNFNVIVNFVVLISMCTVTAVVNGIYDARTGTSAAVFEAGSHPSSSNVVNALVNICNIVPISLYISIEVVKTIQAFFISQDVDMYYKPLKSACVPKTWNISDDLGQIEYIFSDKTGTLTQNVMEFQKCSIHGVTYGEAITEAQRGAARRKGRTDLPNPEEQLIRMAKLRQDMLMLLNRAFKNRYVQEDKLTLQRAHIISFFRALAVCHTALADKPEPGQDTYLLGYKAESPDESALVGAARDVGFPFISKSRERIDIEVMGQPESYVLLKAQTALSMNASRRIMTPAQRETSKDMETFANDGLRTLLHRIQWSRVYDAAASSTKDRDEEIDKANALVEHSLHVLGATALEDKLQEGVPEAIEMLHAAGIKLWVLTGDKVQTAIEIDRSWLDKIASIIGAPSRDSSKRGLPSSVNASFAVVIDGDTLRHALDPSLKPLFLNLGTQCEDGRLLSGLACTESAYSQVSQRGGKRRRWDSWAGRLASSHVSDYAFGQFRILTKLLIVHGRWSYRRIADMHSNFFYKVGVVSFDQDINAKAAMAFSAICPRNSGLEYTRTKFWLYMLDGLYHVRGRIYIPYLVWTGGLANSWNGKTRSLAVGTTVAVAAIDCQQANTYVRNKHALVSFHTHYSDRSLISSTSWTVITWVMILGPPYDVVDRDYSFFESFDFIDEVQRLCGGVTFWATVILS
ncbi:phospholipid-translocating P-type ATPase, partial [Lactarius sanguifluus]